MWHLWYIRSSSCSSIVVHQLDGCVVPDLGLLCLQGYTTPIIRTVLFLFLPSFGGFFFRCCLTTEKALSRQFNEGGRFEFDLFRIESSWWKREWKKKKCLPSSVPSYVQQNAIETQRIRVWWLVEREFGIRATFYRAWSRTVASLRAAVWCVQ